MVAKLERNENLVYWLQVCGLSGFFTCVLVIKTLTLIPPTPAQGSRNHGPDPRPPHRRRVLHAEPAHDEGHLAPREAEQGLQEH